MGADRASGKNLLKHEPIHCKHSVKSHDISYNDDFEQGHFFELMSFAETRSDSLEKLLIN